MRLPGVPDPEEFDQLFNEISKNPRTKIRAALYGGQARAGFRSAQPFRFAAEAAEVGVELTYEEEYRLNVLHRLTCLSNLDKHRRLTVMAWWPDLVYWSSNGPSNRRWVGGDGTFEDGSILGYMVGSDADVSPEVFHDFNLVLTDDPAHDVGNPSNNNTEDLVAMLGRWHEHVTWVFAGVFDNMSRRGVRGSGPGVE